MGMQTGWRWLLALLLATAATAREPWVEQQFAVLSNGTFLLNLGVGTPPQQVSVDLDFGSGDLLIHTGPNPCSTGCNPTGLYPTFNPNNSKSYHSNQSFTLGVRLSDGSYVAQEWGWDDIQLSSANLSQSVVALGVSEYRMTLPMQPDGSEYRNLWGLGPRGLESCVLSTKNGEPYPVYDSVLYQLKRDNITSVVGFSVWIDPITQAWGRLLLGAEDANLYSGELETTQIVNYANQYDEIEEPMYLGVALDGLSLQVLNATTQATILNDTLLFSQSVGIFNSRRNFSMPEPWLSTLGTALGGIWSERLALYFVSCDIAGYIELQLASFILRAPLQDFISNSPGAVDAAGNPVCLLQIELAGDVYLSNKFLQNYYFVVDYDASEVSFGVPNPPPRSTHLQPVTETSTFTNRNTVQTLLGSEIAVLHLSQTISPIKVPQSVSQSYILGGPPQPTRITGSGPLSTKSIPKATDASNFAVSRRSGSGNKLYWLLMLFL